MLSKSSHRCDFDRINEFLNEYLSDPATSELVAHLDQCESCREYLEQQTSPSDDWIKVRELLQPSDFDQSSSRSCSAASFASPSMENTQLVREILAILKPTDDPTKLGRLGGYEVSGIVGAGGMGVVLKAVDSSLERVVAIKVMAPRLASRTSARQRFAREAKAAAAVLHPNVIPIHSVSIEGETPYFVMTYVRGESLQKRLERIGPLPIIEVLRIAAQVAAGLAAAHDQGLIHRDIKPENILLEEGVERVTLTDFGLARSVDDVSLTRDGAIAGTPQYMSPEQSRGDAIDARSDLFSLGSLIYAMLAGHPPFAGDSTFAVMRQISEVEPVAVKDVRTDTPQWLCHLVQRLMSKDPAHRFESTSHVQHLLESCLHHLQKPDPSSLPEELLVESPKQTPLTPKRNRGTLIMLAAIPTLLLVGFIVATQLPESPFGSPQETSKSGATSASDGSAQQSENTDSGQKTKDGDKPADEKRDAEESLTWKALGLDHLPEDYAQDELELVKRLDASRGTWLVGGTFGSDSIDDAWEAEMKVGGGIKNALKLESFPGWQFAMAWPRDNPEYVLTYQLMLFPEKQGVKLMLFRGYAREGDKELLSQRQVFSGKWDLENSQLNWSPMAAPKGLPNGAPNSGEGDDADDSSPMQAAVQIVLESNGRLKFRDTIDLVDGSEVHFEAQAQARVGEPYVEKEIEFKQLPNDYKMFFASKSEIYLMDNEDDTILGPAVVQVGMENDIIFGRVAPYKYRPEASDIVGYFWLDSKNGKLVKGLELAEWKKALNEAGVQEPTLYESKEVGPRY